MGWMGLKRGHHAKPLESVVEKGIFLVSLTAIVMIFLIFLFVGREALPIVLGRMNTSLIQPTRPVSDLETMRPAEI